LLDAQDAVPEARSDRALVFERDARLIELDLVEL
jgi:hypothetical protein